MLNNIFLVFCCKFIINKYKIRQTYIKKWKNYT